MRTSVIAIALLATACQSTKSRVVAGTALTALGVGTMLTAERDCSGKDLGEAIGCGIAEDTAPIAGGMLVIAGIAMFIAAGVNEWGGEETAATAPVAVVEPPKHPPAAEPTTDDPMLRKLTLQANVAARAGHCNAVEVIADRVDEIDRTYRRTGFVADPFVADCL